jgi:hypothetical protein
MLFAMLLGSDETHTSVSVYVVAGGAVTVTSLPHPPIQLVTVIVEVVYVVTYFVVPC